MEQQNYKVERADQLDEPGLITNQIVKKIVECDVLIADLSEANPNVFYELALRHGLKKPFVHMIDSKEKIPFDNSQVRTIQFDIADLDSVDAAKKQLEGQIKTIAEGGAVSESPISVAFDLEALKAGGSDGDGILPVLLDQVMSLSREVRGIGKIVSDTRKRLRIRDKDDLLKFLNDLDAVRLAYIVEKEVTDVYPGDSHSFSILSNLPADQEQQLIRDLTAFVSSETGHEWTIDQMPF